jgi:hypothetical protein
MLDRRRRAGQRLVSTVFIAAGSLIVAGAGSLETFGHGEYLYAGEIVGITVIFAGFLGGRDLFPVPAPWPRLRRRSAPPTSAPQPAGGPVRSLRRISDREERR